MISVVMPVWVTTDELYELTRNALASLGEGIELIIVDNASTIGSDQFMSVADTYVKNKVNLGYPAAVNQGIALANGDLIAVANNDIRVSPNWQEVTKEVLGKIDNAGSLHFRMQGYEEPFDLGKSAWGIGKERWCTGSFFVFTSEAIEALEKEFGYVMDEDYGLGGYDDWDWHHRLNHLLGWKSVYTNAAAYQHKDSSTLKTTGKPWNPENREQFKELWGNYPEEIWKDLYPEQMKTPYIPFP